MMQCSPFPSKRIAQTFGKKKADKILIDQIKAYHPDIVLTIALKYLDEETILAARKAAPNAILVGRDGDPFPERNKPRLEIAKNLDIMTCFYGGRFLQTYKDAGVPLCALMPAPCDPDIQRPYKNLEDKWKSDIIFTGREGHSRLDDVEEKERAKILNGLKNMERTKLYGCFGSPTIDGIEVFFAISGAKTALSINAVNDVQLYHSDRLVNCLSCGTFTLAKRVPDTELLFEDNKHLRYFDTADEFFELADWYLRHDDQREKIAAAGMEHAHREFNCTKIAKHLMDLIETGDYDAPWKVII
jgi:hypothetical protein